MDVVRLKSCGATSKTIYTYKQIISEITSEDHCDCVLRSISILKYIRLQIVWNFYGMAKLMINLIIFSKYKIKHKKTWNKSFLFENIFTTLLGIKLKQLKICIGKQDVVAVLGYTKWVIKYNYLYEKK